MEIKVSTPKAIIRLTEMMYVKNLAIAEGSVKSPEWSVMIIQSPFMNWLTGLPLYSKNKVDVIQKPD